MLGLLLVALSIILIPPLPAAAQSYQSSSDGLASVHVRRVAQQNRPMAFDVCARLLRQADAGPLEVRLNVRGESGEIVAQMPTILVPTGNTPVCQRISLPERLWRHGRWEIARIRFRHDQSLRVGGRLPGAG
jgi:hypothetical protein